MSRVSVGRVPMRRVPNRRGYYLWQIHSLGLLNIVQFVLLMYLCVMKDVLFESSMPKYWRISTSTGERTTGGDYGYAAVWVPMPD